MSNELLKRLKEEHEEFIYEFELPTRGQFKVEGYPLKFKLRIPTVKDEKQYILKLGQVADLNEAFVFIIRRLTDIANPEILLPVDRDFILLKIKEAYAGQRIRVTLFDDRRHAHDIELDLSKVKIPEFEEEIPQEYTVELPVSGMKLTLKTMQLKDYISANKFAASLKEGDNVLVRMYIVLAEAIKSFEYKGEVFEGQNLYDKYLVLQELTGRDRDALVENKEPFFKDKDIEIPVTFYCEKCATEYKRVLGVPDIAPF